MPTRYVLQPVDPNARSKLRRAEARKRRHKRRLVAAGALLALVAAGVVGGVIATHVGGHKTVRAAARAQDAPAPRILQPRPLPGEMRGIHVTMALAGLPRKLDEYIAMKRAGLNTIELDVKDENGELGFPAKVPLAHKVGAALRYYPAERVVAKIHAAGLYLIGRVVTFEDPLLSAGAPQLAIRRADGSRWLNSAGLGWTNPYDRRVWKYNVDIAEQAAKLGFDEIQFDYVRFPSDGDISQIRYPGRHAQPMGWTIPAFVKYASSRLKPLGVRVSVDVFGLSATRNLGIGQFPRRIAPHVDAIYPMVYPSHYVSGEYNIVDPDSRPGTTVAYSLRDFRSAVRGRKTLLIPWLQDFSLGRQYTLSDVQDQIQAARLEHSKGFMLWNAAGVYSVKALSTPPFR
ncbi:MAG TPA: putative glycoside hydrolase [Gaiellaceae bacterium]|nr:putative glycoside hydrolase [Gaiellaceae bacterium]